MMKKILSIFSGCGGFDLGMLGGFQTKRKYINELMHSEWIKTQNKKFVTLAPTDFEIVFANDIKHTAKVAWTNYFKKYALGEDIFRLASIVDLVKQHKKDNSVFPKSVDIVTGGFPCQDFSVAGKRKGFNSHKSHNGDIINYQNNPNIENRGQLYMWMREVIDITDPKVFIAENVKGLISLSTARQIIEKDFENVGKSGFLVFSKVLNASNYGVPQNRERIFFIGLNKKFIKKKIFDVYSKNKSELEELLFPQISHSMSPADFITGDVNPLSTVADCLSDLVEPAASVDPSHQNYSKAKYLGQKLQGQREVNLDKPSPTIRAEHHGNIEYRRLNKDNNGKITSEFNLPQRRLSVRECARLQTFPDDYEFVIRNPEKKYLLSPSEGYKLIGDAVPPLLAYSLAKKLEEVWGKIFKRK